MPRLAGLVTMAAIGVASMLGNGLASAAGGERLPAAEAAYQEALVAIEQQEYPLASARLRALQAQYPSWAGMARVQTRIAVLHEARDAGDDLEPFLAALDARDDGDWQASLSLLDELAADDAGGVLVDDALYLRAYLQLMELHDFPGARDTLVELRRRFPDTAYADSADYLAAIALEQSGETRAARRMLDDLRHRHTSLSLPLGFRWPRGTALSRYWFDRADRRIDIIDERLATAGRVKSETRVDGGAISVRVAVNGSEYTLHLTPSALVREVEWLDARRVATAPPSVNVYQGTVAGVPGSWVRVSIDEHGIRGVLGIDGEEVRIEPANLIGTLEYYQPAGHGLRPAAATASADAYNSLDLLRPPPENADNAVSLHDETLESRAASRTTDVRAVPVSLVIDSRYDNYHAGNGLAEALNSLNVADGLYRQFGLALTLDKVQLFDDTHDPLKRDATSLENHLRSFRRYRLDEAVNLADSALTYYFTGNPRTDITLGLAWINTLCRSDGYDVGVTTPSDFADVLLAHELGHSFGALHDSDTACNKDSTTLMWPNISARTRTHFTSCARGSIAKARRVDCLAHGVDVALDAVHDGESVRLVVSHGDTGLRPDVEIRLETEVAGQVVWPAACVAQTPTGALCHLKALLPGEQRELELPLTTGSRYRDLAVSAAAEALALVEISPADNSVTVRFGSSDGTPLPGFDGDGSGGSGSQGGLVAAEDSGQGAGSATAGNEPTAAGGRGGGSADALLLALIGNALFSRRFGASPGRRRAGARGGGIFPLRFGRW